ncbi:MAG: hypothetical protein FJW40_04380 [Acidobacteria bacterium]|nr:hypothetical protein [Acidobacteriota bacterium]
MNALIGVPVRGNDWERHLFFRGNPPNLTLPAHIGRLAAAGLIFLLAGLPVPAQPGYYIHTLAGSDQMGDGGPAERATFRFTQGLALDGAGNLYIADADGHRVRRIAPTGIISTLAGTGAPGFTGDGGPANRARLDTPYGLAADRAGNVYIADLGNRRVRRVGPDGRIATVLGPDFGTPRNVAVDPAGNLFVSDFAGHRVWRVPAQGEPAVVAGSGTAGSAGDGGPAPAAQLRNPAGLVVDGAGVLYIADSGNGRVRRVANGAIASLPAVFTGQPTGLALAGQDLWVAQSGGVISVVRAAGVRVSTLEGRDVVVDPLGTAYGALGPAVLRLRAGGVDRLAGSPEASFRGDDGPADLALLNTPGEVAVDRDGVVYFADEGNRRIRRIGRNGVIQTIAGPDGLAAPRGVAVDAAGAVWFSDPPRHGVFRIGPGGPVLMAGTGVPGFGGDGGPGTAAALNLPCGITFDRNGNLLIADAGNHRVRLLGPDGKLVTLMEGLSYPRGVTADSAGNVYVADTGNNRVAWLNTNGILAELPLDSLRFPYGVAMGRDGSLLVADSENHRILVRRPGGGIESIAGTREPGLAGDGGPAVEARLRFPLSLAVTPAGDILISDRDNHRIRRLTGELDTLPAAFQTGLLVSAATQTGGAVAPGELVSILGVDLAGGPAEIRVNGAAAPVLGQDAGRLTVQVPEHVEEGARARVDLRVAGEVRFAVEIPVVAARPGLFTEAGQRGQAVAIHEDGLRNGPDRPVAAGGVVQLFATGLGRSRPEPPQAPLLAVTVTVGGEPAEVLYTGHAPGQTGVAQINIRVPASAAPGERPLQVRAGEAVSPAGVHLTVRGN